MVCQGGITRKKFPDMVTCVRLGSMLLMRGGCTKWKRKFRRQAFSSLMTISQNHAWRKKCLIENVRISQDESNRMADDVGVWHNIFHETSGKLYCT